MGVGSALSVGAPGNCPAAGVVAAKAINPASNSEEERPKTVRSLVTAAPFNSLW